MLDVSTFTMVYKRYRFIALAVCSAVLVAGTVDLLYGGIGRGAVLRAPEALRASVFFTALVALLGLELLGYGHESFRQTTRVQVLPFLLRLFLLTSIFLVTDFKYTRILFLVLVLYSFLGVSRRLSYGLACVGVVGLLGLSVANPVLMDIVPAPPPPTGQPTVGAPLPRPARPPVNIGGLIDASMGSVIALFFTLLLARAMAAALQDQQKLEDLNASLETSHQQLKAYSSRVAELATSEERNRLARDIHDSLGHHLAAINIQLEKANAYRERDPGRAEEALAAAKRSVQDALQDVRTSVSSLRKVEPFSLEASLDALVKRMSHGDLEITLSQTGDSAPYGRLALMTLYRVVQEALTNVHKHAQASLVTIHLDFSNEQARLDLSDNGRGFDVAAWENSPLANGLRGLQERISLVGGQLTISSKPCQTSLHATLPKSASIESHPETVRADVHV